MSDHPFHATQDRAPTVAGSFDPVELGLANRNHGAMLELLACDVTPAGAHYLLNHFDVPVIAANDHAVTFDGAFDRPGTLNLAQIMDRPAQDMAVTLECAGNGRAGMDPRPYSMPWMYEAVGNALWTGTPLAPILRDFGIGDDTVDIVFTGADYGFDKAQPHFFARSLTPKQLTDLDVMLVYAMNGQPLLPQHGAPLRIIVPGWYGMASVKWVTTITAWTRPFDGIQQVGTYRYRQHADDPGEPVQDIQVKSLMIPPGVPDWMTRMRYLRPGPVTIQGRAWSGLGRDIVRVELGDGTRWHEATLGTKQGRYGWTQWSCEWTATPGPHILMCRATDEGGHTQPIDPPWNLSGFANNAVQRVKVFVDTA